MALDKSEGLVKHDDGSNERRTTPHKPKAGLSGPPAEGKAMQGSFVAEFTGQRVSSITHRGTRPRSRPASALAVILPGLATGLGSSVQAQTFTVLYSFAGYPTDGAGPEAGLLMDASGNLYGTTKFGGSVNLSYCGNSGYSGCGTGGWPTQASFACVGISCCCPNFIRVAYISPLQDA